MMTKNLFFIFLGILFFAFSCEEEKTYDPLKLSIEKTDLTSFHSNDGEIEVFVEGGKEPYAYEWSNGATTSNLTDLSAGEYAITVTDDRDEKISESITLNEPEAEDLVVEYIKTDASEFGKNDGAIDLHVYGGATPYSFNWSTGESTEDIENLLAGTYAVTVTDAINNSVNKEIEIEQPAEIITVTDVDGNTYKAVEIGEQTWMAENLKVTKTPGGEDVETLIYNDFEENLTIYGRLYDWNTANKVCPEGWHLPSQAEWQTLATELGGRLTAGGKLKDTLYWNSPNVGATNETGMSIRAAGEKDEVEYRLMGQCAVFWTSNSVNSLNATEVYLTNDTEKITYFDWHKVLYYSVRCIKDEE